MLYPIDMTIGKRIAAARARFQPKKLTQATLAKKLGVTEQAVSQWELDKDRPGIDRLADLAEVLKVPVIWLLKGGADVPDENHISVQIETLSPGEEQALGAFIQGMRQSSRRTG